MSVGGHLQRRAGQGSVTKPSRSTWHCRCGGDLAFISRVEDGRAIIDPMRLCGRFFPIPDARPVPLPADPERPCPLSSPLSCL